MGPDCGTAIINGVVLGFGNAVNEGPIGIVAAAGTGVQEVSVLISNYGSGLSHAIGTGSRDLSDEVGGITAMEGIKLLEKDEKTKVIVLISKPPGSKTVAKLIQFIKKVKKPVVLNLLGAQINREELAEQHVIARTLEEAAILACELVGLKVKSRGMLSQELTKLALSEASKLSESQQFIRGLYAGGTLAYEAQLILSTVFGDIYSNTPINPKYKIDGFAASVKHTIIDMGAEEFVVGRAHPMIDYTLRKRRILQEANDPQTAVLLLDVELGYGSHPDPAGELVPAIRQAKKIAEDNGRYLPVVVHIVGTKRDFQGLEKQAKKLREAGVIIAPSNVQAVKVAAIIASKGKVLEKLSRW